MNAALLALLASPASACSVCMGGGSGGTGAEGWRWAILLLLGVTMSLVGGVAWALWRVEKARAAAEGA